MRKQLDSGREEHSRITQKDKSSKTYLQERLNDFNSKLEGIINHTYNNSQFESDLTRQFERERR